LEYPWYTKVNGEELIQQGDFIDSCPVPIITSPNAVEIGEVEADAIVYDVIIMSQSCDLIYKKIDFVVVCPYWPLSVFEGLNDEFKSKKRKEALRQGNHPRYHMLNECAFEGFEKPILIVDFTSTYTVDFHFLTNIAKERDERLRLLPPYREHLSQAFARFFMRVGLPVDISPFTKKQTT